MRINQLLQMKNKIAVLFFLGLSLQGFTQQDAIYSQYMFNPFAINPAYAGTRNSMSGVILHRSQWVGIDGAPRTQTATLHAPINKYNLAWGINLAHDQIGPNRNTIATVTGAYQLRFRNSKLNLALRGGIYNSVFNLNKLNFKDEGDQFDIGGVVSAMVPTLDFGAYYYKTKFYLGISATHMIGPTFNYENLPSNTTYLRSHVMIASGYVFEIGPKFVLKPSLLLKSVEGVPLNLDINLSALFYKKFWLGMSFRNKSSVNFMLDMNITDYLRMGYAYDLLINKLSNYSRGTHEIFIGFDFSIKKSQTVSPRYL